MYKFFAKVKSLYVKDKTIDLKAKRTILYIYYHNLKKKHSILDTFYIYYKFNIFCLTVF